MDWTLYETDDAFADLQGRGKRLVGGIGPSNPDIMLVGEAPGQLENAKREPFLGPAGLKLNELIKKIGRTREEIYLTNVVKYWPTRDNGSTRSPSVYELMAARPYILQEIEEVNPVVVGLLGFSAISCVLPDFKTVNEAHAQLIANLYVPLYHPAQIIYRPEMEGKILKGYKMLNEYVIQKKQG